MPSNLKKRVHARMAKTGETYQQALSEIRKRRGGRFERIARNVIALAQARNEEERRAEVDTPDVTARIMRRVETGLLPCERALLDYLTALAWEDLRKVEVVMAWGRP